MDAVPPPVPPADDSDLPPSLRRRSDDASLAPSRAVSLVLVAFAILAGIVALYRVLDTRDHGRRTNRPATLALAGLQYNPATRIITGVVNNRTEGAYENVRVTFELLDSARAVVGTIRDSSAEVPAGGAWTFRIAVPTPGVRKVRLVDYAATRRGGSRSNVRVLQDV